MKKIISSVLAGSLLISSFPTFVLANNESVQSFSCSRDYSDSNSMISYVDYNNFNQVTPLSATGTAVIVIILAEVAIHVTTQVVDGVIVGLFDNDISGLTANQIRRIKNYILYKRPSQVNNTRVPNYHCHPAWGDTCQD